MLVTFSLLYGSMVICSAWLFCLHNNGFFFNETKRWVIAELANCSQVIICSILCQSLFQRLSCNKDIIYVENRSEALTA